MSRIKRKESAKVTKPKGGTQKPDPKQIQVNRDNAPLLTVGMLDRICKKLGRILEKLDG